jgi:small basic protein (TIGR04137 family)
MSLHSSLKIDKASATARTVQTRIERIKEMMKKGLWKEDSSVTGLPKTKIVRVKAKKKVKAEGEGEAAAAAPAAGAAKPAAGAAKPAAGAAKK